MSLTIARLQPVLQTLRLKLAIVFLFACVLSPATANAQFGLNQQRISESQWSRGFHGFNMIAEGNDLQRITLREFQSSDSADVLLIVIGRLRGLPLNVIKHVNNGGSAMVASDSTRPFSEATFSGVRFGKLQGYRTRPADAFGEMQDCPIVRDIQNHPIVSGVDEIVTNQPGYLMAGRQETIAWLPIYRNRRQTYAFAAANQNRNSGRFVALADQSIFTNQMIVYGDNARFADQTIKWLKDGKRTKLLILVDGEESTSLDPADVIVDVPPPSQREVMDALQELPPAAMLEFANSVATVVEDENMINDFIHDSLDRVPESAMNRFYIFLMFGIACLALVVAFVCQRKLQNKTASVVAFKRSRNEQNDIKKIQFHERQQAAHFLLDKFCVHQAGRRFNDWPSFPTEMVSGKDRESKSVFESMTRMSILYKSKPTSFWTRNKLAKLKNEVERWREYFANAKKED
ncbi:DUF4350 domain-containing protein [Mariniblastus fucicola]|uniref:DUF4350 domain-containing protein n=1 Tax=Mariniblastus fucicola TaxID=980251 RepID=UPI0009466E76|nr:DUF4350 domain-containing protein [Mariniblastus fucicola]